MCAGAVLVGLISCVPLVSQYFTTNEAVLERVHGAIKPVSLFLLVNGLMCAGEGKKMIVVMDELFFVLLITTRTNSVMSCHQILFLLLYRYNIHTSCV